MQQRVMKHTSKKRKKKTPTTTKKQNNNTSIYCRKVKQEIIYTLNPVVYWPPGFIYYYRCWTAQNKKSGFNDGDDWKTRTQFDEQFTLKQRKNLPYCLSLKFKSLKSIFKRFKVGVFNENLTRVWFDKKITK